MSCSYYFCIKLHSGKIKSTDQKREREWEKRKFGHADRLYLWLAIMRTFHNCQQIGLHFQQFHPCEGPLRIANNNRESKRKCTAANQSLFLTLNYSKTLPYDQCITNDDVYSFIEKYFNRFRHLEMHLKCWRKSCVDVRHFNFIRNGQSQMSKNWAFQASTMGRNK